jgi:deoxyadenosine/deoxycytidine kinase
MRTHPTIILEGPEAAGKSTLAKRMSSMYGYEVVHFSYPKTDLEKKNMFDMYQELVYANNGVIIDRCWYSEMVYGPIVRDGSNITLPQMYELEKMIISQGGGMVIHCTAPIAKLWERFKRRGDDYIRQDFETLLLLKKQYETLMHKVPHVLPVMRYEVNEADMS